MASLVDLPGVPIQAYHIARQPQRLPCHPHRLESQWHHDRLESCAAPTNVKVDTIRHHLSLLGTMLTGIVTSLALFHAGLGLPKQPASAATVTGSQEVRPALTLLKMLKRPQKGRREQRRGKVNELKKKQSMQTAADMSQARSLDPTPPAPFLSILKV
ncbi:hypothetical protein chiPu_0002015 [Chiloscyllium punctatum]|uniref:Uncharacterized protein n=1 Tax=Chiloscyllium punctatum TaxID=137246 RepID=A0A401RZN0_CHIPU|nr:hypothetical protein [Chiloscyllium punctatum]